MTSHANAKPVFTITTLGTEPTTTTATAATTAPVCMRLSRRAAVTAALITSPAPVIATATTGHAGWTTAVFIADIAVLLGSVISHAHAEAAIPWRPEPQPVEIDYIDAEGNHVHYTVRTATPERA